MLRRLLEKTKKKSTQPPQAVEAIPDGLGFFTGYLLQSLEVFFFNMLVLDSEFIDLGLRQPHTFPE